MRRAQSSRSSVRFSRKCETSSRRRPVVDSLGTESVEVRVSTTWATFVIGFLLLAVEPVRGPAQYVMALEKKESGDHPTAARPIGWDIDGEPASIPIRRSVEGCV